MTAATGTGPSGPVTPATHLHPDCTCTETPGNPCSSGCPLHGGSNGQDVYGRQQDSDPFPSASVACQLGMCAKCDDYEDECDCECHTARPASWDAQTIALQRARVFLRDLEAWQDNLDHPERAASMLGRARSVLEALVEATG